MRSTVWALRSNRRGDSGITTIEALVSMVLIVLIVTFGANAAITSMKAQRTSQINNAANQLVRSVVEQAKGTRWDRLGMSVSDASAAPNMPIGVGQPGVTAVSASPAFPRSQDVTVAGFKFTVNTTVAWRDTNGIQLDNPQSSKYVGITVTAAGDSKVLAQQYVAVTPPLMEGVRYYGAPIEITDQSYSDTTISTDDTKPADPPPVQYDSEGSLVGHYRNTRTNQTGCTSWQYTLTNGWSDFISLLPSNEAAAVPPDGTCRSNASIVGAKPGTYVLARPVVYVGAVGGVVIGKNYVYVPVKPHLQYGPLFSTPNREVTWPTMPNIRKATINVGTLSSNGTFTVNYQADVTSAAWSYPGTSGYAFPTKPGPGAAVSLTVISSSPLPSGGWRTFTTAPFRLENG